MRIDPLDLCRVEHGTVEADAQIPASAPGNDAPEAGAEAAGHACLEGELAGNIPLGADAAHALEHGGRPAGIDDRPRIAVELLGEELGYWTVVPGGSVVGGEHAVAEQRGAAGVSQVAKAEQDARLAGKAVAEDRKGRDADPTADEDRAQAVARRAESGAERPERKELLAGLKGTKPARAGPDILEQVVGLAGGVARDGQCAREVGPLVLPPPQRSAAASMANCPGAGSGPCGSATRTRR